MTARQQLACLWCGPIFVVSFLIGMWPIAGFIPPSPPTWTAAQVAAFYQHDTNAIRLGQIMAIGSSGLMMPWVALIAAQMRRIEGCSRALVYTELGAGAGGILLFIGPSLVWSAAAFSPLRDPQLTLLLHELGWIMFILPFTLAVVQGLAIAAAIFSDRGAAPVFPRWAAYFNVWVALLILPGGVATFFKTGPFAWNGLFPFWLPLAAFTAWFVVMFVLLRRAIATEAAEIPASPSR